MTVPASISTSMGGIFLPERIMILVLEAVTSFIFCGLVVNDLFNESFRSTERISVMKRPKPGG